VIYAVNLSPIAGHQTRRPVRRPHAMKTDLGKLMVDESPDAVAATTAHRKVL
jgi:hypothetical protein